jgi:hypothetical protein
VLFLGSIIFTLREQLPLAALLLKGFFFKVGFSTPTFGEFRLGAEAISD